ncbi:OmpP1/FadL family transporter [Sungkyunkwania multivorans]|uniref:OmpP1/FadL family transporter n=1 Tax=Sungkyunkwania multivorans TaxID=1173618 RepID=A0ABW3D3H4_9FLAO
MKKQLLLMAIVLLSALAYAGGYRVALQGQKSLAMGHTGVAVVNNAEIVFFNPAGMAFLGQKFSASIGVTPIFSNIRFQNEEFGWSTDAENPVGTPFYAYATYKINDHISAGLGIYTPYGSGVEYPANWEGSHLLNSIDLAAIFVQPSISIKLSEKLSIGGGPILALGNVNFNRNLNRTLTDTNGNRASVSIEDSGITAWGYAAGVMFRPSEKVTLGINYRSEIIMEVTDGKADFENIPSNLESTFADGTFSAELPLPAELSLGVSYQITTKWLVAMEINRTFWDAYENLNVFFSNGRASFNPRNYQNSSAYRFGVQYDANTKFTFRAGYYFDESPVQEGYFAPETPRNNSDNFTGGLTFKINNKWAIDASFLFIHFDEVDASYDFFDTDGEAGAPFDYVPFGGTYKNNAFIPGIGISYSL